MTVRLDASTPAYRKNNLDLTTHKEMYWKPEPPMKTRSQAKIELTFLQTEPTAATTPSPSTRTTLKVQATISPPSFASDTPVVYKNGKQVPPPKDRFRGFDHTPRFKTIEIDNREISYWEYASFTGRGCQIEVVDGPAYIKGWSSYQHSGKKARFAREKCVEELRQAIQARKPQDILQPEKQDELEPVELRTNNHEDEQLEGTESPHLHNMAEEGHDSKKPHKKTSTSKTSKKLKEKVNKKPNKKLKEKVNKKANSHFQKNRRSSSKKSVAQRAREVGKKVLKASSKQLKEEFRNSGKIFSSNMGNYAYRAMKGDYDNPEEAAYDMTVGAARDTLEQGAQNVAIAAAKGLAEGIVPKLAEKIPGVHTIKATYAIGKSMVDAESPEEAVGRAADTVFDMALYTIGMVGGHAICFTPIGGQIAGSLLGNSLIDLKNYIFAEE